MEFKYEALDSAGKATSGVVNAQTQDSAIESLQKRGLTLTAIHTAEQKGFLQMAKGISFFGGVSSRDLVLLSRQIATLFEAQVSALRIFRLLRDHKFAEFKTVHEHSLLLSLHIDIFSFN